YEDFDALNGIRVATNKGNLYAQRLQEYCKKNNINVTLDYHSYLNSEKMLADGLCDALVSGSLHYVPNTKIVARLSTESFYYAVRKDHSQLMDEIDRAMAEIYRQNVYFDAELHEKYYGDMAISQPSFSPDEVKIINQHPILRVAINSDMPPLQYIDSKSGEPSGCSVELLNLVAKNCGFTFEYLLVDSSSNFDPDSVDLLANFVDAKDFSAGFRLTKPYHEAPMVLVGKRKDSRAESISGLSSLVMVDIGILPSELILKKYPHFQIVRYPHISEVTKAFDRRDTDLTLLTLYSYDELVQRSGFGQLTLFSTSLKLPMCLRVSDRLPHALVSILNKGISRMSLSESTAIIFSSTMRNTHDLSFGSILRKYSLQITLAAALIVLAMLLLVVAIITSNRNKHAVLQNTAKTLKDIAYHDPLTGLDTFVKFKADATLLLAAAKPGEYRIVTVDIDNFKYVNDMLGYDVGNEALRLLGQLFHQFANEETLVSRIVADNFIFMLRDDASEQFWPTVDHELLTSSALSSLLGENYTLNFSTGSYLITDPTRDLSLMIDCANIAKKTVKNMFGCSVAVFTEAMDIQMRTNRQIILAMEQALKDGEFVPYLQPKFELRSERICGAEVLVRWITADHGMLPPSDFIPLFERNGFIVKLDYCMFEQTCRFIEQWRLGGHRMPRISVNISRLTLTSHGFIETILELAHKYSVSPSVLEIELTESVLDSNLANILRIISELKDAGFFVAIDDFGSGYSSLNLLKDIRADVLKVDKEFIGDAMNSARGKEIMSCIIELAKKLTLETVAEGVETVEQADSLRAMGCDVAQGFYYARPMPLDDFELLLSAQPTIQKK
ncbi:MAG: EAL domain-containing protein, partial [Angelakisella sp.]